jgi:hypothetical protein
MKLSGAENAECDTKESRTKQIVYVLKQSHKNKAYALESTIFLYFHVARDKYVGYTLMLTSQLRTIFLYIINNENIHLL